MADIWEKNSWITSVEADYAKSHNAMFMTRPMPGLKLITLNTDLYYVRNYFTMLDTEQDDPSGLFHDLILELQDSEDRGERGIYTKCIRIVVASNTMKPMADPLYFTV